MGLSCKPTGKFKSTLAKVEKLDKSLRAEIAAKRAELEKPVEIINKGN